MILATLSGRASMFYANRYYWGSSAFGFNFYQYSFGQSSGNSIIDDYAHNGIVLPFAITKIYLHSTIRNDNTTDNVTVYLHTGSRPNGSTSTIVLTEIGSQTAGTSGGVNRHYNADNSFTVSIAEGQLIFLSFKRAGTNKTCFVNFSTTISIE